MNRIPLVRLGLAALLAALIGCGGERPASTATEALRGPVILISIDTLRADRLPVYGAKGVETPAIDALARDSVVFESAWSQVPLTLPSHVSLLTGRLPAAAGVRNNLGYRFDPAIPSLPALFRQAGWETGAAVSAYVLRSETGLGAVFDHYDDEMGAEGAAVVGEIQRDGAATTEAALRWIRERATPRFFFFLHLFEPHAPYAAPEPFGSRYASSPYDGEIAASDAYVGRLIDHLKTSGLYDEATIVFFSDHGEGLGDHGEDQHGIFLYRESIHVPLLVKLPGNRRAGTRVEAPAGLVDVFPTITRLAGLETGGGELAGMPLDDPDRPLPADRRIFSETMYPRIHLGWSDLASLVDGTHHYIDAPRPELYDLRSDPAEKNEIASAERRVLASMREAMKSFDRAFTAPSAVSPEEAAKLAALGYLGGAAPAAGDLPDPKDRIGDLQLYGRAAEHYLGGDPAAARALLRDVVSRNPTFADAWTLLGKASRESGDLEEAVRAYRRTIEIAPMLAPGTSLSLAEVLLELGRFDEAHAHAELALSAHPDPARVLRARARFAQHDVAGAERELQSVRSGEGRVLLAQIRTAQRRFPEALQILEPLIAERSASGVPLANLHLAWADVAARTGRMDDARAALRREIDAFPHNREASIRLGAILLLGGDAAGAERVMADMARVNPDPSSARMIAEAYRSLGRPDLAERWERSSR